LLWGAGRPEQRTALIASALRCRLGGSCAPGDALQPLAAEWRERWPRGLAIPNPEIPNRNPLAILSREGPRDYNATLAFLARRQMTIDHAFEPANARPPLDFWRGEPERLERLVRGLAAFFPEHDIAILQRARRGRSDGRFSPLASGALPVFRPAAILREVIASISPEDVRRCCTAAPAPQSAIKVEASGR
jgi:hypothetical protein